MEMFMHWIVQIESRMAPQQPVVLRARVDFVAKQPEFPSKSPSKHDNSERGQTRKPRGNRAAQNAASQLDRAEAVSGRWLVKAMLATLVVAGVALYLTVCLLFYQGQWQFAFSPPGAGSNRRAGSTDSVASSWARRTGPASAAHSAPVSAAAIAVSSGLPIGDHPFDYTEEGIARLDGWWIPAGTTPENPISSGSKAAATSSMTLLFCPDGRSNLPQNVAAFRAFHTLGISVFAFDYRGFGASQQGHPSQQKAYQDG